MLTNRTPGLVSPTLRIISKENETTLEKDNAMKALAENKSLVQWMMLKFFFRR